MSDKGVGYIKLMRTKLVEDLIRRRPTAWALFTIIALRAKREQGLNNLEMGEAYIGDFENYGVTRQVYRSDLHLLKTNQLLTIKSTTKGTIVKIVDTTIFDINIDGSTNNLTKNQPSTNHQLTTKKNERNKEIRKESEEKSREYLKSVPDDDLRTFSERYACSQDQIKRKAEELYLWATSSGKTKSNYRMFLQKILLKDFNYRPKKVADYQIAEDDYSPETMARRQ